MKVLKSKIIKIKKGKNLKIINPVNIYECKFGYNCFVGPFTEIQKNVINIISKKMNFCKNLKNFLFLLIEKKRIFFLKRITQNFLKLCASNRGEVKALMVSSKELTENELENLSSELSKSMGSTIKFEYSVDKSLIGGLKLQLGSIMIDTSLKNKLRKYKQLMIEN